MKINITRPIIFFDLETTGVDVVKDHIVELCYIKLFPDGNEESRVMRLRPTDSLGNTIHIPQSSTLIHGITDDDVANCPTFKEVAPMLKDTFTDADLAGYNSNYFDIPMLAEEFLRIGINIDFSHAKCIDVCVIFKKMEQRTLSAAYKFYCKANLDDAHSAMADTRATLKVLEAQLDMYADTLKNDVDTLSQFSSSNRNIDYAGRMVYDEHGTPLFNFGKYKGQPVANVLRKDPGYYSWMMQGEFALNTKQMLKKIKLSL